jgi:hypothetical protein
MRAPDFDPPLYVNGRGEPIRCLDEAARFLHEHPGELGRNRVGVLRQMQVAKSTEERLQAAAAFRAWAETVGVLETPA